MSDALYRAFLGFVILAFYLALRMTLTHIKQHNSK